MTKQIRDNGEGSKAPGADRQHWQTPRRLAREIVNRWGIVLDVAADYDNAVCERFVGAPGIVERPHRNTLIAVDALAHGWGHLIAPGQFAFCNPPFSSFDLFVDAAVAAAAVDRGTVFLGPCSTDTRWFQRLINVGVELVLLRGRVHYEPPPGVAPAKHGPAFASALYVLHPGTVTRTRGAPLAVRYASAVDLEEL